MPDRSVDSISRRRSGYISERTLPQIEIVFFANLFGWPSVFGPRWDRLLCTLNWQAGQREVGKNSVE